MNKLLALQNKFQKYLLHFDQDIHRYIASTGKVSVKNRLDIYAHAYRLRLHDVLADSYPVLQAYLGSKKFEALCHDYMDAYPSHYRSIRWFGDQLEGFLNQHPKYNQFQYLSELAKVEWTMTLIFDAADSQVVTLETMATIPVKAWAKMRFRLHPSVHFIDLSWNVMQLWQATSAKQKPKKIARSAVPITWIFWRKDLISQFCSLPTDEAYAIKAALKGAKFGEICEGLCQWVEEKEVGIRAASLLKGWISQGLIAKVKR